MRPLKFRAWDKCHKEMETEIDDIDFLNKEIYFRQCFAHDFSEMILMQFTGLKDRNGKEIYEGDICEVHLHGSPTDFRVGQFVFDLYGWVIKYPNREDGTGLWWLTGGSNKGTIDGKEPLTTYVQVIGNIYENPKLLEK